MKSLTFRGFEAVAAQAIKELREENRALRDRLQALEAKLDKLATVP
jgi:BMFP domain-containing protein YqiC